MADKGDGKDATDSPVRSRPKPSGQEPWKSSLLPMPPSGQTIFPASAGIPTKIPQEPQHESSIQQFSGSTPSDDSNLPETSGLSIEGPLDESASTSKDLKQSTSIYSLDELQTLDDSNVTDPLIPSTSAQSSEGSSSASTPNNPYSYIPSEISSKILSGIWPRSSSDPSPVIWDRVWQSKRVKKARRTAAATFLKLVMDRKSVPRMVRDSSRDCLIDEAAELYDSEKRVDTPERKRKRLSLPTNYLKRDDGDSVSEDSDKAKVKYERLPDYSSEDEDMTETDQAESTCESVSNEPIDASSETAPSMSKNPIRFGKTLQEQINDAVPFEEYRRKPIIYIEMRQRVIRTLEYLGDHFQRSIERKHSSIVDERIDWDKLPGDLKREMNSVYRFLWEEVVRKLKQLEYEFQMEERVLEEYIPKDDRPFSTIADTHRSLIRYDEYEEERYKAKEI